MESPLLTSVSIWGIAVYCICERRKMVKLKQKRIKNEKKRSRVGCRRIVRREKIHGGKRGKEAM